MIKYNDRFLSIRDLQNIVKLFQNVLKIVLISDASLTYVDFWNRTKILQEKFKQAAKCG